MCNGQDMMPRNMYVGVKVLGFEWLITDPHWSIIMNKSWGKCSIALLT